MIVDRVEVFNSVEVKTLVQPQSQASQGSPRSAGVYQFEPFNYYLFFQKDIDYTCDTENSINR